MILNVYTVYDSKAKVYARPFQMVNNASAIRAFESMANDKTSDIGKFPNDFSLWRVGEWDDIKGKITSIEKPEELGIAVHFIQGE